MKTFKILTIFLLSSLLMVSCLVDQTDKTSEFDQGPNLLGFLKGSTNVTKVADGETTTVSLTLKAVGPTWRDITEEITATIEVDPSSTAIEGTHFLLPQTNVTFKPSNNMVLSIDLVVLSEGISAPSTETLILNIVNTSSSNVIPSGRTGSVNISLKYLCFSDLAGDYTNPDVPSGAEGIATFTQIGDGQYTISALPYLGWSGTGPIWFNVIDECGELTIVNSEVTEAGYLAEGSGTINDDGSMTLTYVVYHGATPDTGIWFDFSNDPSTYTPVDK